MPLISVITFPEIWLPKNAENVTHFSRINFFSYISGISHEIFDRGGGDPHYFKIMQFSMPGILV